MTAVVHTILTQIRSFPTNVTNTNCVYSYVRCNVLQIDRSKVGRPVAHGAGGELPGAPPAVGKVKARGGNVRPVPEVTDGTGWEYGSTGDDGTGSRRDPAAHSGRWRGSVGGVVVARRRPHAGTFRQGKGKVAKEGLRGLRKWGRRGSAATTKPLGRFSQVRVVLADSGLDSGSGLAGRGPAQRRLKVMVGVLVGQMVACRPLLGALVLQVGPAFLLDAGAIPCLPFAPFLFAFPCFLSRHLLQMPSRRFRR